MLAGGGGACGRVGAVVLERQAFDDDDAAAAAALAASLSSSRLIYTAGVCAKGVQREVSEPAETRREGLIECLCVCGKWLFQ